MSTSLSVKKILIKKYLLNEVGYAVFEECLRNIPIKLELIDDNIYYIPIGNKSDSKLQVFDPSKLMGDIVLVQNEMICYDNIFVLPTETTTRRDSKNVLKTASHRSNRGNDIEIERLKFLYISKRIELIEQKIAMRESFIDMIIPADTNINIDEVVIPKTNSTNDADLIPYITITANTINKIFHMVQHAKQEMISRPRLYDHQTIIIPEKLKYKDIELLASYTENQIYASIENFTLIEMRRLLIACLAHILIPFEKCNVPHIDHSLLRNNLTTTIELITETIKIDAIS